MRLWRIANRRHAALDGEGARQWGGRWNSPGHPVVYASETASLAALEKLVWIDPDNVPEDLQLFGIELPPGLEPERLEPDRLPSGWREVGSLACVEMGDAWIESGENLALAVPSALVPGESNVLINPRHPSARRLRVVESLPFVFDPRLLE